MTKDKLLLTEARFIEPYLNKVGSKEAGQRWTEVSEHLNSQDGFRENPRDQRSVRERVNKLLNEFKAKTRLEEAASGIAVEPLTENEILLEEIVEIMQSLSSEQTSSTKISESKEREKALKMRDKAMKTWGKTKKDADHSDSDESDEKCVTTPRRSQSIVLNARIFSGFQTRRRIRMHVFSRVLKQKKNSQVGVIADFLSYF